LLKDRVSTAKQADVVTTTPRPLVTRRFVAKKRKTRFLFADAEVRVAVYCHSCTNKNNSTNFKKRRIVKIDIHEEEGARGYFIRKPYSSVVVLFIPCAWDYKHH
jgi:hypothetical protein